MNDYKLVYQILCCDKLHIKGKGKANVIFLLN